MAGAKRIDPRPVLDPGRKYEKKCHALADRIYWEPESVFFTWTQVAMQLAYDFELPLTVATYHAYTIIEGMFDKQGKSAS